MASSAEHQRDHGEAFWDELHLGVKHDYYSTRYYRFRPQCK